jgi:hypothetical protein
MTEPRPVLVNPSFVGAAIDGRRGPVGVAGFGVLAPCGCEALDDAEPALTGGYALNDVP